MSGRVFVLVLLIIVVLIAGTYFAFTYQPELDESNDSGKEAPEADAIPDNKFKDIDLTVFNDDSVKWQIEASDISSFSQGELFKLSPFTLTAYDQNNNDILYTITADYCNYQPGKGKMEINGSVLMEMEKDELTMQTTRLSWDRDKDLIMGSGGVRFSSPSYQLTGGRFETNGDFTQLIVYKSEDKQAALLWKEVDKRSHEISK